MTDLHIDDFYRDVAKTLAALYSQFPRKITLYVEDISGPDSPDEFGLHSPRHEACFQSLLWLANTDYINYEQVVRQEALDQVVLTHRAFLLLNAPIELPDGAITPSGNPDAHAESLPPALAQEESLVIHRIREQLKRGTSFTINALMREVLAKSRFLGEKH